GDATHGSATSACTSETLTVGTASPTIATTLSSGSITVGGSVHDSATLTGATTGAGGTVTYGVFTNNTCTAVAGLQPVPAAVTVTNHLVPDSGSVTFPNAGTFLLQASYSGGPDHHAASNH